MLTPEKIWAGPIKYWISLDLTDSSSGLVYKPLPFDDPGQWRHDITLAKEKPGRQPKIPLRESLKKTIEYLGRLLNREQRISPASIKYVKPSHKLTNVIPAQIVNK